MDIKVTSDSCFTRDKTDAACETICCDRNLSDADRANHCMTRTPVFEIDLSFGDCTNYCVPNGTASEPISASECTPGVRVYQ